jgi:putative transcriptional regulator
MQLPSNMADKRSAVSGKMILDSGRLAESYFERTVIFMVRHDKEGALGLVVNRPTKHTVAEVLKEKADNLIARVPLSLGGPVQPQTISFLVESCGDTELNVLPWVAWARSLEEVEMLVSASASPPRIRAFAGYAGWGRGQLEGEFEGGCWVTVAPRPADVFVESSGVLWRDVIARQGGIWRLVADMPRDVGRN